MHQWALNKMPKIKVTCEFCGKEFQTYSRPNRPKQKDWYCCAEHYFLSGNRRGGGKTLKELKKRGYYIEQRQWYKLKQIQSYGKKGVDKD